MSRKHRRTAARERTTPPITHADAWWDEITELDTDLQNVRGMSRLLRRGVVATRADAHMSRGSRRYARNG